MPVSIYIAVISVFIIGNSLLMPLIGREQGISGSSLMGIKVLFWGICPFLMLGQLLSWYLRLWMIPSVFLLLPFFWGGAFSKNTKNRARTSNFRHWKTEHGLLRTLQWRKQEGSARLLFMAWIIVKKGKMQVKLFYLTNILFT